MEGVVEKIANRIIVKERLN